MSPTTSLLSVWLLSACGLLEQESLVDDDDEPSDSGASWDNGMGADGGSGDGGDGGSSDGGSSDGGSSDGGSSDGGSGGDGGSGDGGSSDGGSSDGGSGDGGSGDGGDGGDGGSGGDGGDGGGGDGGSGDGGSGDGGSGDGGSGDGGSGDGGSVIICEDLGVSTGDAVATGNTSGMGDDFDASECADEGGEDVALSWTAPTGGCWQIDTIGSDFDTVLLVLEGSCGGLVLDCDDDAGGDGASLVELELGRGDELTLVVDGRTAADAGDYQLNIVECDGESGTDTGVFSGGYRGEATIDLDEDDGLDGYEEAYFFGRGDAVECTVLSQMTGITQRDDCDDCDWAFDIEFHDSEFSEELGCDLIGVTDVSLFDAEYSYGYQSEYYVAGYGTYEVLQFYFSGFGWYPVALAEFDGTTFTYDWPFSYYYYYYL